jgi:Rod binding domain-containing protein
MNIAASDLNIALLQKNKLDDSSLKNVSDTKKLKEACDNFESFFMQQMLDISLKSSNFAGEETGSKIIKGMYTENLSKASAGSLGISKMLFEFLSEQNKGVKS